MQPVRTPKQELQTLDYMADLIRELTRMAARDQHRLLGYLLHSATIEIDELKRLRSEPSDQKADDAA
jgi:hypothetical protein